VKSIYLAGPEVFLPHAVAAGEAKKALCQQYGFEGLYPLDNEISGSDGKSLAFAISRENENLIRCADIIIANLTPFRGASADAGTVYELGLARGLNKVLAGYSNTTILFAQRSWELYGAGDEQTAELHDRDGMSVENFGLHDNLMIEGGIKQSGGIFISNHARETERFTDLSAFEQVLKRLAEYS